MKTLIVTTAPPPVPGLDVHGVYRRLSMFVKALSNISDSLRILYIPIAAQRELTALDSLTELSTRSLADWGVDGVGTVVASRQSFTLSLLDLLSYPFSIRRRPKFRQFSGEQQTAAFLEELAEGPDLILVHRLAASLVARDWTGFGAHILFDLDDIEHRVKLRATRGVNSIIGSIWQFAQVPGLYWAEKAMARMAHKTFVCSAEDKSYLARIGIRKGVTVVANAVDFPPEPLPSSRSGAILFLGGYHYEPNVVAAHRLITKIWPKVKQACPAARLLIAGASPENIPSFVENNPGVEFLGFVRDLEGLYRESAVICCPIQIAGGTRVKLIEAAAHAKAMVSTRMGAEGLTFSSPTEILIEDADEGIANACIALLKDPERASKMGIAARKKAQGFYELSSIQTLIQDIVCELTQRHTSGHALPTEFPK